jgi:hypothetical protein
MYSFPILYIFTSFPEFVQIEAFNLKRILTKKTDTKTFKIMCLAEAASK